LPVMLRAQAVGILDTNWGHTGPKTVDSMIASDVSRGLGGAHLRFPTGGYIGHQNTVQRDRVDSHAYLCVRNIIELPYVRVGVVEPADKGSSSSLDYQVTGGAGIGR
jgi:hypothetical protein